MAGFLTDYANNKLLDLVFGGSSFQPPASLYLGLSKTSAGKAGLVSEPSGGGYQRVAVANDGARFPAAVAGSKSNASVIAFPSPTGDWGTVVSVFVADQQNGGNILAIADLPTPKTIAAGAAPPSIAVGALYLSHT